MLAFAIGILEKVEAAGKDKVLLFMFKCHSPHIPEVSDCNSALLRYTRRRLAAVSDDQVLVLSHSFAHLTFSNLD